MAINEPILPKSCGAAMPRMGPITIPTNISTHFHIPLEILTAGHLS